MITKMDNSLVMDADDISRELRISKSNAYNIMHSQNFPLVRVGVKRLICYRKDFEKFVAEHLMKK